MKIVGIIPARLGTGEDPLQNVKVLGGLPLVNYTLRTMSKVGSIDEIVIFASDSAICKYVTPGIRYKFIKRPLHLDSPDTNIQDIVTEFLKHEEADIIVLWHITSPFLKTETILECIEKVKSYEYDSAFTAMEIRKFCWFGGKPLNYSLSKRIPRTQDIEPVIVEQSHLYVFRRDIFEKAGHRISGNPYIKIVDHLEGHDIYTPMDFAIAELMVNTGFFELD
jgi:CMP-N-acetylneuraminic acid synthetase